LDNDVVIKAIFGACLTVMYSVLFLTLHPDTATALAMITAFTNTLTGVFVRNLTQREKQKRK